ncbi:MAG TPA: phosphotransferase [Macromonas sp.]|nr:phosphotransferase [Macromonas sp.]
MMAPKKPLPRTIEELTPAWLNEALQERCPGIRVTALTFDHIIPGTTSKILMDVQYEGGAQYGMPHKLCVKGEFDEGSRQALSAMTTTGTQIEAAFFNDLAPRLGLPLPRHWYGGSEPGMGILALDNLAVQHYRFGTPTEAWAPELVAKALDILAILHGSTWDQRFPEIEWLTVGSTGVRQAGEMLMSSAHWQNHFEHPEAYTMPAALKDNLRILEGYRAMWRFDDAHAHCVIHGDAHVGNTCISPEGQPFFIDWAGPSYSHWGIDVPYFMIGALTVEDRRAHERELFNHYLDRLVAHGAPAQDRSEAWDDYRRHAIHGLMWATLPPQLQSRANSLAMGERFTSAVIDHDSLKLLGV